MVTASIGQLGESRLNAEQRQGRRSRLLIAGMTIGHLGNDSYANFVPYLMPLLAIQLGFSLTLAGVATTSYMLTSSLLQPYFGHFADRRDAPWIAIFGVCVSAFGASMLGLAPDYAFVLLFAALCGLGTAAYHPQAASTVYNASGANKGSSMSIYMFGGNIGLAVSPLIVSLAVDRWGLHSTPILLTIGAIAAILVYWTSMAAQTGRGARPAQARGFLGEARHKWDVLWPILLVVSLRAITVSVLTALLPFFLREKHLSDVAVGGVISVMFFAGALTGIGLGFLADRSSRPTFYLTATLAGSTPLLLGLLPASGGWLWLFAVVSGALLNGSFPLLTTTSQRLMPGNVGMVSGLVLGFSQGLGGLVVAPLSAVADATSPGIVLAACSILPVLAALAVFRLRQDTNLRSD